jgi:hypothetical protein
LDTRVVSSFSCKRREGRRGRLARPCECLPRVSSRAAGVGWLLLEWQARRRRLWQGAGGLDTRVVSSFSCKRRKAGVAGRPARPCGASLGRGGGREGRGWVGEQESGEAGPRKSGGAGGEVVLDTRVV